VPQLVVEVWKPSRHEDADQACTDQARRYTDHISQWQMYRANIGDYRLLKEQTPQWQQTCTNNTTLLRDSVCEADHVE